MLDNHPFWPNPHIFITPQIAGQTNEIEGVDHIVNAIKNFRSQKTLMGLIDRERGSLHGPFDLSVHNWDEMIFCPNFGNVEDSYGKGFKLRKGNDAMGDLLYFEF